MFYKCNNCEYELDSNIAPDSCVNCKHTSFSQTVSVKIEPNEIIAGFKLIKRLGQGGMGEVWLAEQTSMERLVALKILKPELSNAPNFRNRFINEIKHSAKLEHPNIVTAFDAGSYKGLYYLASSFIKGKQLLQKLEEEKVINEKEALHIALGISKALAYAWNEFNMLHRDIKPGNIIIDITSVPKLLDMGIAKTITEDNSLTMEGDLVGTPFYISPEQARSEDLDFRSDIYSLGATLYHIMTGVVPFQGTSTMGIIAKHITEVLTPPIKKNPALSVSANDLIVKMMAKDKNNRFHSWEAVINFIENILSHTVSSEKSVSLQSAKRDESKNINKQDNNTSFIEIKRIKAENKPFIGNSTSIERDIPPVPISNSKLKKGQLTGKKRIPYAFIVVSVLFSAAVFTGLLFLCFSQGEWRGKTENILNTLIFSFMTLVQKKLYGTGENISGTIELKKIIFCSLIPVVLLFSAFWSGALAEKYLKNRPYHFLLGILLPVIYPMFIFKRSDKTSAELLQTKTKAALAQKKRDISKGNLDKYKYNLFKKIAYKDDGIPNGPFKFELMNDTILDVTKILEVRPTQLAIEIKTENGNLKRLKIPFSSIKTFLKI